MIRSWLGLVLLLLSLPGLAYEKLFYPKFTERFCSQEAQPVSNVFVVGDSSVDSGNFYNYSRFLTGSGTLNERQMSLYPWSGRMLPGFIFGSFCGAIPGANYHGGRFCDDLMAPELIARALYLNTSNKTEFVDQSHGGSTVVGFSEVLTDFFWSFLFGESQLANISFLTNSIRGGKPILSSVEEQINHLVQHHAPFSEDQIFMLAGGANDYLNRYWNYRLVVTKLSAAIENLYAHGARTIFWGTVPDVTKTPCLRNSEDRQEVREVIVNHNRLATKAFFRLKRQYPDLLLLFFDYNRMFDILLEHARQQDVDTETPCLDVTFRGCSDNAQVDICESHKASPCKNRSDHFYVDSVHPSSTVQNWIFNFNCKMLSMLNYEVKCPEIDRRLADDLLLHYFTGKPGYLEREYVQLIFEGRCPAEF
ncbi:SGNH/GDSL hydrolase family protein [Endozoicomonas sp. 2B-B]